MTVTMSGPGSAAGAPPRGAERGAALGRLTRTELRLFLRERIGPIWGVGFPLVLLIIFGSIPSFSRTAGFSGRPYRTRRLRPDPDRVRRSPCWRSTRCRRCWPATGRRASCAACRPRRWARSGCSPPSSLIDVAVVAVTLVLVLAVARIGYGVALPRQLAGFVLAALLAAAALLAIGLFVAAVAPTGRAANAIGTILFFPMMFFAGLWLPIAADAGRPAAHQPRHPARRGGAGAARQRRRGTGRTRCSC